MAVGVLLCFEPPLESGKEGEPIKRSLAAQSRFYEQVLSVLLNEVNIDTTEWQRCILLPSAWGAFMERAYFTCEESRRAELELQKSLGHRDFTPEDFNLQCKCAWLWVRDRILNVIKTSVKNAPTSHANAVFAMAGLVRASNKFQATLDDATIKLSDDNESFVKHHAFMLECTETILCALMPNYHPNGNVHSWLLTHLSRPNSSAGFLVQGCSCASLCLLTSVLVSNFGEEIPKLFESLLGYVPHTSPVLSFYASLALGLLVRSLCDTGAQEPNDAQIEVLLYSAKEICKFCSCDEPITCAFIGLTLSVSSLSHVAHEECKDWISTSCSLFYEKLLEENPKSMNFEMLSICVSAMMIGAIEGNCMAVENMVNLASWFEEKQLELPQCSGVSVSSGMLIEALGRMKHVRGVEIKQKLQKEWFNTLTSEKKPTLHRIAALNGLCALHSCGQGLLQCKSPENSDLSSVNDLVSIMFQFLSAGRDTGIQNICSWEVGRLYSVYSFQQQTDEGAPTSYSYLGEKSVLKPLVKMVLSKQNTDEHGIELHHVIASLNVLKGEFPKPLPPLNWNSILAPLIQQYEDSLVLETALNIALNQAKNSTDAMSFLSAYCCPPLYHTLKEPCQHFLLSNIPVLCQVLAPQKLKTFLQTVLPPLLKQKDKFQALGSLIMQGIKNAFIDTGTKQQNISVLQDAFVSMFRYFTKDIDLLYDNLDWTAEMFQNLPSKAAESLLCVSRNNDDIAALTTVACHLVKTSGKQLSFLRPYVEEGKHVLQKEKEQISFAIYQCFLNGSGNAKSEVNNPEKCISWLLEIIGWMNVLNDSKSQYQLNTVGEVFSFLVDVCSATIIGCSGINCSYDLLATRNITHHSLLENLPIAVTKLNENDFWSKIMEKIIVWLLLLLQSVHTSESDRYYFKSALCCLKNSGEFKKLHIWTDVINAIYLHKNSI